MKDFERIGFDDLDADMPLNNLPSNRKVKSSKSNALQSRHELNDPEEIRKILLSEEALVEIMSNTLKHAASSMFVTSFTTSAAFCTNMLTNISFVQVFGRFHGHLHLYCTSSLQ